MPRLYSPAWQGDATDNYRIRCTLLALLARLRSFFFMLAKKPTRRLRSVRPGKRPGRSYFRDQSTKPSRFGIFTCGRLFAFIWSFSPMIPFKYNMYAVTA